MASTTTTDVLTTVGVDLIDELAASPHASTHMDSLRSTVASMGNASEEFQLPSDMMYTSTNTIQIVLYR